MCGCGGLECLHQCLSPYVVEEGWGEEGGICYDDVYVHVGMFIFKNFSSSYYKPSRPIMGGAITPLPCSLRQCFLTVSLYSTYITCFKPQKMFCVYVCVTVPM